jgi:hypothetical protein
MTRTRSLSVALLLTLLALLLATPAAVVTADSPKILDFDTLVGVPDALTGTQASIRGVNGGGIAWTLASAKGKLTTAGHVDVRVTGLVLAGGANSGSNPIGSFRAIVSCLTADGSTVNLTTDAFPATTGPASEGGGNARITTDVELPDPCIAPIVFVTSPGGSWFAVTGG